MASHGPSLDYLVFEKDGGGFGGVGKEPLLERITAPIASDGARRVRVTVGDARLAFALDDNQVPWYESSMPRGFSNSKRRPYKALAGQWVGDMLPSMDESLDINFKPFSQRHRRLFSDWPLERPPERVRQRLWASLRALNEPFDVVSQTNRVYHSHDIEQAQGLYTRLLGLPEDSPAADFERMLVQGETQDCFDVLECFAAWLHHTSDRLPRAQRIINETLRDFSLPWRMAEGLIFQVDNDFLEDEVLAEVTPLLGLTEFEGAKEEFTKGRDHLTVVVN